jgi:hypothetical protein
MPLFRSFKAHLHGTKRAGGNCSFPSWHLTRRSAGVRRVLVATYNKNKCFVGRRSRGKTPAVPVNLLSKSLFFRDGLRKCSFGVPYQRGLPHAPHHLYLRCRTGTPAGSLKSLWRFPFYQCLHAQGRRGFSPATSGSVTSICSSCNCGDNLYVPHSRCMLSQRCTLLDAAPSVCGLCRE